MSNQSLLPSTPKLSILRKSKLLPLTMLAIIIFVYIGVVYSFPCLALNGIKFRSFEGVRVGVILPGDETPGFEGSIMYPTIFFKNGKFVWWVSDMGISGSYECHSGNITAITSYDNNPQIVQFDPFTGILLWNGEKYHSTSQIIVVLLTLAIRIIITKLVRESGL